MEACVFCKILAGEIPSTKVHEEDGIVAIRDVNPQAPVHVLLIPREHIADTNAIEEKHAGLIGRIHIAAARTAEKLGVAKTGYRLVLNCGRQAGQTVFHIHYHLLGGRALAWPPG